MFSWFLFVSWVEFYNKKFEVNSLPIVSQKSVFGVFCWAWGQRRKGSCVWVWKCWEFFFSEKFARSCLFCWYFMLIRIIKVLMMFFGNDEIDVLFCLFGFIGRLKGRKKERTWFKGGVSSRVFGSGVQWTFSCFVESFAGSDECVCMCVCVCVCAIFVSERHIRMILLTNLIYKRLNVLAIHCFLQ